MSLNESRFEGGRKSSNYGESKYSKLQHHVQSDMLYGYAPNVEAMRQQTQLQDKVRVQSWHQVGAGEKSVSAIKDSLGSMRQEQQKRERICQILGVSATIAGVAVSLALVVVPLVSLFAK